MLYRNYHLNKTHNALKFGYVTGYPATLKNCKSAKMRRLSVFGNTFQDRTPSPDNPVEIQSVGEHTINIFNKQKIREDNSGYYWDWDPAWGDVYGYTGDIFCYNSGKPTTYLKFMQGCFKENTQYTFVLRIAMNAINNMCVVYTDGTSQTISVVTTEELRAWKTVIFTSQSGKTIDYWRGSWNNEQTVYIAMNECMIVEGAYTAETIPSFEPFGYKVPIVVSGKNLFPAEAFKNIVLANIKDATVKIVDGRECISVSSVYLNNITGNGPLELKYLFTHGIKENTQYTLTFSIKNISVSTNLWVTIYHTDGTWKYSYRTNAPNGKITSNLPNGEWGTFIVTSDAGKTVSGIGFTYANGGIRLYDHSTAILVEGTYSAGTTPAYEPYHTQQTIPIYLDSPLYGNGNASDTVELNVANRTAMLTRRYGVVSFDGSESWSEDTKYQRYILKITNSAQCDTTHGFAASNYLKLLTPLGTAAGKVNGFTVNIGNIYIRTDGTQTLDEFKAWLSELYAAGMPLTVVYQLATPVVTDISNMQDWDNIPKLNTHTNIITSTTSILPSNLEVKYIRR